MDDMPADAPAPSSLQWWDIPGALGKILRGQARHTIILTELLERTSLMATQDQVDALAAQLDTIGGDLSTALAGIQTDLDTLKAANPALDLSSLSDKVSALAAVAQQAASIDAEN